MAKRHNPYIRFSGQPLSLNDYLAIDRTILANERTLLAYGRTALALLIVGGTAIQFIDSAAMTALGWLFVILAGVVALAGAWRYWHADRLLRATLVVHGVEEVEQTVTEAAEDKKTRDESPG